MAKYKVFPKEFNPVIASGPPTESYLRFGDSWTEEDTEYMRKLEQEYVIQDEEPVGLVFMKLDEEEL